MTHGVAPELVITGDDFGLDEGVNAAIEAAHIAGVLTSASLMVGAPAADDAIARARLLPGLSTGLHLVICDGWPISDGRDLPDLVDASGRFHADAGRVGPRIWLRRERVRAQLEREIRAQLDRYLASGLRLDHVDSHHHLHMHPVVFETLVECIDSCGARPVLRFVDEDSRARRAGEPLVAELVPAVFRALTRWHRRRHAGRQATQRVYGLRASGRLDEEYLLWLLPRLRSASVEIYSHPSRSSEAGRREERALCSGVVKAAVERAGYLLTGSRDLRERAARSAA